MGDAQGRRTGGSSSRSSPVSANRTWPLWDIHRYRRTSWKTISRRRAGCRAGRPRLRPRRRTAEPLHHRSTPTCRRSDQSSDPANPGVPTWERRGGCGGRQRQCDAAASSWRQRRSPRFDAECVGSRVLGSSQRGKRTRAVAKKKQTERADRSGAGLRPSGSPDDRRRTLTRMVPDRRGSVDRRLRRCSHCSAVGCLVLATQAERSRRRDVMTRRIRVLSGWLPRSRSARSVCRLRARHSTASASPSRRRRVSHIVVVHPDSTHGVSCPRRSSCATGRDPFPVPGSCTRHGRPGEPARAGASGLCRYHRVWRVASRSGWPVLP